LLTEARKQTEYYRTAESILFKNKVTEVIPALQQFRNSSINESLLNENDNYF
jgi:hypothetical protein